MLNFKDIVRYICATVIYLYKCIRNLFKMESVYDCARPFMLIAGIFGMSGSALGEIEGVRSVRNTKLSLIMAVFLSLVITPTFLIHFLRGLFSGEERSLLDNTTLIIWVGQYVFTLSAIVVTCFRTHVYCKDLIKVPQILNDTDMMLKQENIHVNYWRIILKTILFGLISCHYYEIYLFVNILYMRPVGLFKTGSFIASILIEIAYPCYFMWLILFLLIIRERFVGLNKLLLQNAQVPSIIQDDSLLRRISLARDIHEQLSEAIELFSDLSRYLIIAVLVPAMLHSLFNAVCISTTWDMLVELVEGDNGIWLSLRYVYFIVAPIIKIVILTAVCETHKNNRLVLTARLRHLISREEDPRIVQQLRQYIWYIHDTVAGLVDLQYVDVDFTLLFLVIDILVQYLFVIYSYVRTSIQGETM